MMQELRDIKDLLEISDYSLYYAVILLVSVCALCVFLVILLRRKKGNEKLLIAKDKLANIDLKEAKKSAYMLTKYAKILAPREECEKLDAMLVAYKYKKEQQKFSDADAQTIKDFLEKYNV